MAGTRYVPTEATGMYVDYFKTLAAEMDAFNDLRERLVKASRDVTNRSKKAIFLLHRAGGCPGGNSDDSAETVLTRAATALAEIRDLIASRIATELNADSYARLHASFTWGLQEYVEAALFYAFLSLGRLASRAELEADLATACNSANASFTLSLHPADYALGAADVAGELMRHAVDAAARGDTATPFRIRNVLAELLACLAIVPARGPSLRGLSEKLIVLRQSLGKVEGTCFQITMRLAEFDGHSSSAALGRRTLDSDDVCADVLRLPAAKKPRLLGRAISEGYR